MRAPATIILIRRRRDQPDVPHPPRHGQFAAIIIVAAAGGGQVDPVAVRIAGEIVDRPVKRGGRSLHDLDPGQRGIGHDAQRPFLVQVERHPVNEGQIPLGAVRSANRDIGKLVAVTFAPAKRYARHAAKLVGAEGEAVAA
nr:hypothetical protein [Sphingobium sp.]